jgi:hypothetical protein
MLPPVLGRDLKRYEEVKLNFFPYLSLLARALRTNSISWLASCWLIQIWRSARCCSFSLIGPWNFYRSSGGDVCKLIKNHVHLDVRR